MPFVITKTAGLFDVKCTVKGGGISGQAGAVRLGVSRALVNYMPLLKPKLRTGNMTLGVYMFSNCLVNSWFNDSRSEKSRKKETW